MLWNILIIHCQQTIQMEFAAISQEEICMATWLKEMVSKKLLVAGSMSCYIFSNDLKADPNLLLQKFSSRINGIVNNDKDGALISTVCTSSLFKPSEFSFIKPYSCIS